jgi:hypothetical protein
MQQLFSLSTSKTVDHAWFKAAICDLKAASLPPACQLSLNNATELPKSIFNTHKNDKYAIIIFINTTYCDGYQVKPQNRDGSAG